MCPTKDAESSKAHLPLLIQVAIVAGLAIFSSIAGGFLWLLLNVVEIRKDRFTAPEGSALKERVKVLEIKIGVINGVVQDIQAIREQIHQVNVHLAEISTQVKAKDN